MTNKELKNRVTDMNSQLLASKDAGDFGEIVYIKGIKVLNLTLHELSPSQLADGGVDLFPSKQEKDLYLSPILNLETAPTKSELVARINMLCDIAVMAGYSNCMVTWVPYAASLVEKIFSERGLKLVYSFTKRSAVDVLQPDGSIKLSYVVNHEGWFTIN